MIIKYNKINTKTYYKFSGSLLSATHYIDDCDQVYKVPQGLKVYYLYRLQRYNYIAGDLGLPYKESNSTVSKVIGIGHDTIRKVYNPLLKKMGLLTTESKKIDDKRVYNHIVYGLEYLDGYLVNYDLEVLKAERIQYEKDENFNYTNMKNLEYNKQTAKRIRNNYEEKLIAVPLKRYQELLQG